MARIDPKNRRHQEGIVNNLLWIAVVLILIWIVASVTKFVAGALLHLLWVLALILLVMWAVRRFF